MLIKNSSPSPRSVQLPCLASFSFALSILQLPLIPSNTPEALSTFTIIVFEVLWWLTSARSPLNLMLKLRPVLTLIGFIAPAAGCVLKCSLGVRCMSKWSQLICILLFLLLGCFVITYQSCRLLCMCVRRVHGDSQSLMDMPHKKLDCVSYVFFSFFQC